MSPIVHAHNPQQFEIPVEDVYGAEIIRVEDLGEVKGFDGEKKLKVKLIWRLDAYNSRNFAFEIHQTLNASLHPKSALYRIITDITGQEPAEGEDFELKDLVGKKVRVTIKHHASDSGRVFANIGSIMRPQEPAAQSTGVKIAAFPAPQPPASESAPANIVEEDIPF